KAVQAQLALLRTRNLPTTSMEIPLWNPAPPGADQVPKLLSQILKTYVPSSGLYDIRRGEFEVAFSQHKAEIIAYLKANETMFNLLDQLRSLPMRRVDPEKQFQ